VAKNITKAKHRFPLRQIRKIPKFFKRIWPVFVIFFVTILIAFLNFEPGTNLIGWDNLASDFAPATNLKRALFSVWEEHQSLGLLGGMAHAADLPRIIAINVFSLFRFPEELFRYASIFIPLLLGPLGIYYFLHDKLFKSKLDTKTSQYASLLGALFYLLNLATVQTFFTPFESFVYFYGAFPWLIFFLTSYLDDPDPKSLLFLFVGSFIAAPGFYIETLFVVFGICLISVFVNHIIIHKKKTRLSHLVQSFGAIIIPQLFWFLPIIFFVLTNGHVGEQAKINLISSPETYYRNLSFGNPFDILNLRGYFMSFVDLSSDGKFDYLMSIWRNHRATPIIFITNLIISGLIITGLYYINQKKFSWSFSMMAMLFTCVFFLIGGGLLINSTIPLVGELFRSPFTKFSTPLSFTYACFFAIGVVFLLDIFSFLHYRLTYLITLFSVSLLLIINTSPIFSGNLISPKMRLSMPAEYNELFNYLNTQDPNGRIANFPQNSFWGWQYYDWGYRGSGFLWYGLRQPLLDRAFDVWEKSSEKYYEEISSALFSNDQIKFESLLDKYDVKWLVLDKHIIPADGKSDLGNQILESFLSNSPKFTQANSWNDKIFLYSVKSDTPSQNFLSVTPTASTTNPFASLSLRPNTDWIYKADYVSTSQTISAKPGDTLLLPSISESEKQIPVRIEYQKLSNSIGVRLTPITPTVIIGGKQIDIPVRPLEISILTSSSSNFILQLNHEFYEITLPVEILEFTNFYPLATVYLPTQQSFPIKLYNGSEENIFDMTSILAQSDPTQCYVEKPNRKIEKIVTDNTITLLGTDVVGCLSSPIHSVPENNLISYSFTHSSPTLTLANANISGQDFNAIDIPQAIEPNKNSQRTRQFVNSSGEYQQINLILEAADTKSVQEIQYKDIIVTTHSLAYSNLLRLPTIPTQEIPLTGEETRLQVSLPLTETQYDLEITPKSNSLFPESRNCDQFNIGNTVKKTTDDGFLYQSKNAIECDYLNLRNFDHSINYLISFDYQFQKGLPMTTCFENFSTRRCDVFERLTKANTTQSIIQPIANSEEAPGYTLHLFTQSIGNRISSGLLKSLSLRPIPLSFLQNISITSNTSPLQSSSSRLLPLVPDLIGGESRDLTPPTNNSTLTSTHPAEFLYTISIIQSSQGNEADETNSSSPSSRAKSRDLTPPVAIHTDSLNLFQTKSPYWKAIIVSESDLNLPPWLITLEVFFTYPFLTKLPHNDTNLWHNSWTLPSSASLIIIYLPQYLEFIGLLLIPLTILIIFLPKQLFKKITGKKHH